MEPRARFTIMSRAKLSHRKLAYLHLIELLPRR